jgi:SWI/SNF-related matrix-associated actin-dependent regulator 1 of chromatin subfamily A
MFTELQKVTTQDNEAKLDQVEAIYQEAQTRLVVWCKYRKEIANLKERFPDAYWLDGSVPQKSRSVVIDAWSANPTGLLIANTAVGGLGIELTAGNLAVYYSNTFRYADRIQSEDRFHRIGQHQAVTYIDLWTNTGMDRIIQGCLIRKKNLADVVRDMIDSGKLIALEV